MSKTKSARPYLKFFPQDWRADECLRSCGFAARGLWMELLALMHRSERYGRLLVGSKSPSAAVLAGLCGGTEDEVIHLLAELEDAGVFSRDRQGLIFSRRMIRDEIRSETAQKHGRKGGNPKLGKQTDNPPEVKGQDNGSLNGRDKGGLKPIDPESIDLEERKKEAEAARDAPTALAPPVRIVRDRPRAQPQPELPDDLRRVMQAANMIYPPNDAALLRSWLADGLDLDEEILPTIRKIAERAPKAVMRLKYFDEAMHEIVAENVRARERHRDIMERYPFDPNGAPLIVRWPDAPAHLIAKDDEMRAAARAKH